MRELMIDELEYVSGGNSCTPTPPKPDCKPDWKPDWKPEKPKWHHWRHHRDDMPAPGPIVCKPEPKPSCKPVPKPCEA